MRRQLALVVPSRGRPASIARLWQTMKGSCTADTTLVVGLDADDPTLADYQRILDAERHPNLRHYIRAGMRKVTAWANFMTAELLDEFDYFGLGIGDDNLPHTYGWDARLLEALQRAPFAFANDLYPRPPGSMCCHVFARREVPEALGYAGPPSISHMYVDVAWWAWGIATDITYLHDVIIEHLHYTVNKSPPDEIYAATYGGTAENLQAWHAYSRSPQLNTDIRKISAAMPFDCPAHQYTPEILAKFNHDLNIPEKWPWQ